MKLGLHLWDYNFPGGPEHMGDVLTEIVRTADEVGFDRISVQDHVWQSTWIGPIEGPMLEGYATLGFIAAQTREAELLVLATAPSYREPGLLAKMVTSLDVLSGGRVWLGIGAGDYEEEARGLGLPFPSLADRYALLEETVQVCLQMWSGEHGDDRPFDGEHVHLERALNSPQALAQPRPPILIAGDGERRTLPLVARYADACNLRPSPEIPHKLDVLRRSCEAEGRDYDAIEKTAPFLFDVGERGEKTSELIERLRWLAGMGIETVFAWVAHADHITPIEVMGREVIPAVADL